MKIAIINGPNLNLLGTRETAVYGEKSFDVFLEELKLAFPHIEFIYVQSNIEGELIDAIQKCSMVADALILNPAGYTHTSVAIGDAVAAISKPVIEVHISNVFSRESFRHQSFVSPKAKGTITGLGLKGYELAVRFLSE
jgi:3-dehydroquinate dehydratase II